jgi:hypothetical protein
MPTPTNLTIRQQSKVLEIAFADGLRPTLRLAQRNPLGNRGFS